MNKLSLLLAAALFSANSFAEEAPVGTAPTVPSWVVLAKFKLSGQFELGGTEFQFSLPVDQVKRGKVDGLDRMSVSPNELKESVAPTLKGAPSAKRLFDVLDLLIEQRTRS